ncbi:hypothetical protein D3C83_08420 [compost metagenome]
MDVVERLGKIAHRGIERSALQFALLAAGRQRARERVDQRGVLLANLLALVPVSLGNARQKIEKARHAVAAVLGKIGAAEERRAVGHQEHGERPAAAPLREHGVRRLVDLVEVRPLLAVDLDVDEVAVHLRRHLGVLEGLVRHDVAPVAGGIADREQDGLAGLARGRERLRIPGMPVHRVVGVLLQVGRGLGGEAVGHGRAAR